MNKLLFLFAIILLGSCKDMNKKSADMEQYEHRQNKRKPMMLNNGAKWMTDDTTRINITEMKSILNAPSAKQDPGKLQEALQAKTDELIKECRMTGPAHEALHTWLENYIEDLKLLKNRELDPDKVYGYLQADLKEFDAYFE
jgi:hypothetical protein